MLKIFDKYFYVIVPVVFLLLLFAIAPLARFFVWWSNLWGFLK